MKRYWIFPLCTAALLLTNIAQAQSLFVQSSPNSIVQLSLTGSFISVIGPSQGLSFIKGMTTGPNGDLYVSDLSYNRIIHYDGDGQFKGFYSTVGQFSQPGPLTYGPDGNLYVFSLTQNRVYKLDGQTGNVLGPVTPASSFFQASSITFTPDGRLCILSESTMDIKLFNVQTSTSLGSLLPYSTYGSPATDIKFTSDGSYFIALPYASQIKKFSSSNSLLFTLGPGYAGGFSPSQAKGLAIGPNDDLFMTTVGYNRVHRLNSSNGDLIASIANASTPFLTFPSFIAYSTAPEPSAFVCLAIGAISLFRPLRHRRPVY